MNKHKTIKLTAAAVLICIISIAVYVYQKPSQFLEVTFFNVGHGDSALIKTPDNRYILIDGGPSNEVVYKLGKAFPFWQRKIDYLILSHPDMDHINGFPEVIKRFQVKNIVFSGVADYAPVYETFKQFSAGEKSNLIHPKARWKIEVDKNTQIVFFNPKTNLAGRGIKNSNSGSLVLKLIFNNTSFLFTGDAESEAEKFMVREGFDLKSDVLKVGHHGSNTSTSEEFLQMVKPEFAVLSVNHEERQNLPSLRIVSRLQRINAVILRTDLSGDIKLISDGRRIWLDI